MKKQQKSFSPNKKKYCFKIAGCQTQIKRPADPSKTNDEWLKSFYLN